MNRTAEGVAAGIDAAEAGARLTEVDGRWTLIMTRGLRHPAERVWPVLTEPDDLARWSPVVPDRPLTSVGPARSCETPEAPAVDAEVLLSDPPRELVHRWGGQLLRWTVTPAANGSRPTLEHTFDARAEAGMYAAGWHLCLAVLAEVLDGRAVQRIVGTSALDHGWGDLREAYDAAFA
ncbi:MAG: SRPBCC domain-containing protein [Candidatus Dormibacteria bacterium]|jgi:uncharacterized protein YndB with AHSA1/START domain